MFSLLLLSLFLLVFCLIVYKFLIWNFDYWHKRGVKSAKSQPLFGSFPNLIMQRQHFANDIDDIYNAYKTTDNFVGVFFMRTPQLLIVCPKLAHEILVSAFKHFEDNDVAKLVDKSKDPLIANNPFILQGQEWREQRALVTPGLTSSRIKVAYVIMQKVCRDFCAFIARESPLHASRGFNGKDLALRFTAENVCDCVLGIKANSFTSQPLPITPNVKKFAESNHIFIVYSLMSGIYPNITKYFKAKFFPKDCENFFIDLMHRAYGMRDACKHERHDFMSHLLSLKSKGLINDAGLISHSMTFLIDGLDTTATAISHCLLLLAREPKAQQKLREEIIQNLNENDELTYEKLNELPYLEACLNESLRIFPPGQWATKTCTIPYEVQNKNGHTLKIAAGETVMIPMYSYHHDSRYYSEPMEFRPERFMPENGGVKKYQNEGIFLGFGEGPRTCLGMRFAQVQAKAAVAALVQNFYIKLHSRTKRANKLDPKSFLTQQDGGVWLNFDKYAY